MKIKLLLIFIMAFCTMLQLVAPGIAQTKNAKAPVANSPVALVKELYRVHKQGRGPILTGKNKSVLLKYFDKDITEMMWKELTSKSDEVGNLDFDPFYNAQDFEPKNFKVAEPVGDDKQSSVKVTFDNFDRHEVIEYKLINTDKGWRIKDLVYSDGNTLTKILNMPHE